MRHGLFFAVVPLSRLVTMTGMRTPMRWWAERRSGRSVKSADEPLQVLPWWWAVVIVVVVVAGGAAAMWLLGVWGVMPAAAKDPEQLRLDRIKTALTVAAGLAAGATLLMTLRRQMLSERSQMYSERAQRFAESEAVEQRSTALYVAAADQLGSDKAAVRLAGLYALERLGQENVRLRQTVVDVWCAYLRMPYTPPAAVLRRNAAGSPEHLAADDAVSDAEAERRQELQVRLTAQRLLAAHLKPGSAVTYWCGDNGERMVVDLVDAVLVDMDFSDSAIERCNLGGAQFHGDAKLSEAQFHGDANLIGAQFHGYANLIGAQFHGTANLNGAQFHGGAYLQATQFHDGAYLLEAQFHDDAGLFGAQFHGDAFLRKAQFHGDAYLREAQFHATASLNEVQFHRDAYLPGTQFHGNAHLDGAQFHRRAELGEAQFDQFVGLAGAAATSSAVLPAGWTLSSDPGPVGGLRLVVAVDKEPPGSTGAEKARPVDAAVESADEP
jgi:uncharacterized protein YjbI with pentapeptide repeats